MGEPAVLSVLESDALDNIEPIDEKHCRFLNKIELKHALESLKIKAPEKELSQFMDFLDDSRDEKISKEELVNFYRERNREILQIFRELDVNQESSISKKELYRGCHRLGLSPIENHLDNLIKVLNMKHNLRIDFEEFRNIVFLLSIADHMNDDNLNSTGLTFPANELRESSLSFSGFGTSLDTRRRVVTLMSGAVAGVVSRTCTAPMDRLKVLMQASSAATGPSGVFSGLASIYREGGWKAFFRGNGTNVIKVAPETAAKFFVFEELKMVFPRLGWLRDCKDEHANFAEKFAAGSCAGAFSQIVVYPLEIAKTRLAASPKGVYNGLYDCLGKIVKSNGMRGLYHGLNPSILGIIPYAGVDLAIYSSLKEMYFETNILATEVPVGVLLGIGATSSLCGQVVSYPLQVIRTRIQLKGGNILPCFNSILKHEGFRGLYRGIGPNFLKSIPSVSIGYVAYETSLSLLSNLD